MFSPTENSHFRKYLTTLGVSIIVAAIAAGGFLFRGQADLLVDQKKLAELTPIARRAIERRQEIILLATQWSPLVVSLICLIGAIISIIGITGWSRRQKVVDSREDLEADKTRAEIRALTKEEKERKTEEDVQIALGETSEDLPEDTKKPPSSDKEMLPPAGKAEEQPQITQLPRADHARSAIYTIERELAKKLLIAFPQALTQSSIAVDMGSGIQYEVDALVKLPGSAIDFLFEVKFISRRPNLRHAVEAAATRSTAAAKSLNGNNRIKSTVPVIIIVSEDESGITSKAAERALDLLRPALAIQPVILHFSRTEFLALDPKEFRLTIESHAKNS